ncbi:hypothetical protein PVK06_000741 [Gossypium arboreum]|uniref:Uncharacterized protein n=1 Tax=Gossypium arboreum TaxID=29729 RepID=A0ABR0QZ71_GOSAR|nr:hypothetical protein PVK06_000741 [Gossypium arboreum]
MTEFDDSEMVQFCLGGLVPQLSVLEFGVALGLYMEEFMDDDDFDYVPIGYLEYNPYEDDRTTTWILSSSIPPHPVNQQEDPEDITNDIPPPHEDPPSQPPPIYSPVHAAASLSDIPERPTRFEQ